MMSILVVYLTFVRFSTGKKFLCSFRRNGKNILRQIMSLVNLSKQMVIYFSHKNWKMGLYSLQILCFLNSLKGLLSLYLLKDSKTKLQRKKRNRFDSSWKSWVSVYHYGLHCYFSLSTYLNLELYLLFKVTV